MKHRVINIVAGMLFVTAIPAHARVVFWVANDTNWNSVQVTYPSNREKMVRGHTKVIGKGGADGDSMSLTIGGKQITVYDTHTRCANLPGSWEIKIDEASGGKNKRLASQCVNLSHGFCANLAIVAKTAKGGKKMLLGVKDLGPTETCAWDWTDWKKAIQLGVTVIKTFAM